MYSCLYYYLCGTTPEVYIEDIGYNATRYVIVPLCHCTIRCKPVYAEESVCDSDSGSVRCFRCITRCVAVEIFNKYVCPQRQVCVDAKWDSVCLAVLCLRFNCVHVYPEYLEHTRQCLSWCKRAMQQRICPETSRPKCYPEEG